MQSESDTYIFSGGGSGGHLFPGIAVAEELRRLKPTARILFVGSERPVETAILRTTGFSHLALPVTALRNLARTPLAFLRRNASAWRTASALLNTERPAWVIGLGGFVSAPAVVAAWLSGVSILLLEQNVVPGAATRWLSGCARQICVSFEETPAHLRSGLPIRLTGNPIRQDIVAAANLWRDRTRHDQRAPRTLLILGGSQGAESLNESLMRILPEIRAALDGWRVVHQTGAGRSAAIRSGWQAAGISAWVEDFFPRMDELYLAADLVISRAGATTLAELACTGCPSILVPYPFASNQHQAANAAVFTRHGAALTISQATTPAETAGRLRGPILGLLTDARLRASMSDAARLLARPNAASQVAELLLEGNRAGRLVREAASGIVNAPHRIHAQELVS